MSAEQSALALVRMSLEAPGTVTDTVLIGAAMNSDDPQQHHLDITKSLMRFVAGLLNVAGRYETAEALRILTTIEHEYQTESTG